MTAWILDAACRRVDPETMFPCPTDVEGVAIAQRICGGCTVLGACRAASEGQTDGVWAGELRTPPTEPEPTREITWTREKATESSRRSRAESPITVHGTDNGYTKHRARGENACPDCLTAHRIKSRRARDRRRKARQGAKAAA